ncbi:MAG: molybdopterin molybdotransferase MoeA [Anaerolineales bacterium]|uniref:molybdopterin molybdotransferase MoeA n=1 Tax=Candidatus Villigracilis proximus TaxID=3140683 RepID=UPI003134FFAF|nr:molybdopterin molybdotransferase MoeA [Anaerolineales bacterium]
MLSVTEARERILSVFQTTASETISLIESSGRILAVDIAAANDLPLFNNSAMDGFAIRSVDSSNAAPASPLTLSVVADIPAGSAGAHYDRRTSPAGADAVIPVEHTDFNERSAGQPAPQHVTFTRIVKTGENIRLRGTDLPAGNMVLKKGHFLKPQDLGLLAMLGIANIQVYKKPRIALLSTGDELLKVDEPLTAGKIHDSNSYALAALIESANAEVIYLGIANDTRESVKSLLQKAIAENVDLIVSSAGVSVCAFDFVQDLIESNGSLNFWRVNMRPGKPLAFGEYNGKPFIGLPGNPVSAFVGFEVFVRPVLEKLSGRSDRSKPTVKVRCGEEIESDGRESYLRAKIRNENGIHTATLTGNQGSGNLLSLVQADALLIIPAGVKCVPVGQEVDAILL